MYIDFAQPFELPPYWLNHPEVVKRIDSGSFNDNPVEANGVVIEQKQLLSIPHACPLQIKWESEKDWWQFPIEPVVTINGKNTIVKRSVLKAGYADVQRRGTVKELWSQDDYEVNISGVFIGHDKLPEGDIMKLRKYCEGRQSVMVSSPLFTIFNITKIAIEDFQLPFTKGIENQMFSIKASSDDFDDDKLLIQTT